MPITSFWPNRVWPHISRDAVGPAIHEDSFLPLRTIHRLFCVVGVLLFAFPALAQTPLSWTAETARMKQTEDVHWAWAGIDTRNSSGHVQGVTVANAGMAHSSAAVDIIQGSVTPALTYTCDSSITAISGVCSYLNSTIAALYTSRFTNVNANIYITFGSTGLGQNQSAINEFSYSAFRTALQNGLSDANDTTAFTDSVTATNPIDSSYDVYLTNANARALGFSATTGLTATGSSFCTIGTTGCYDAVLTVSSSELSAGNLYFRSDSGIASNQYDFYSVVEHETDEILGTLSCSFPSCGSHIAAVDVYRYQSNGARSFAAGNNSSCATSKSGNACFSIDGVHMLQQYNNLNNGEDSGDWDTNCSAPLVQDAEGCPGIASLDISPTAEILVLDVIGYTSVAAQVAVPNVVNMTAAAAQTAITNAGLTVGSITTVTSNAVTPGDVVSESPGGGSLVNSGSSVNLMVSGSQPISVSPPSGSAGRQVFSFVARDSQGASSIGYVQFLFSKSGLSALNACYISYDPIGNVFYLLSDDMTSWYGLLPGSSNTAGNAQCEIHGATSDQTFQDTKRHAWLGQPAQASASPQPRQGRFPSQFTCLSG
jgi:hypothetical protein